MASRKKKKQGSDAQGDVDRALQQQKREDLVGDMEENRNLTGSTTWETVSEKYNDENQQRGRRTQAASPREQANRPVDEDRNPPYTTTGPITVPKFGSAGSGGLENEPGPERD
ncbi:MAG TPA: hypothetical protein VIQ60_04000 [Gemmatimonadaceae bacterium]